MDEKGKRVWGEERSFGEWEGGEGKSMLRIFYFLLIERMNVIRFLRKIIRKYEFQNHQMKPPRASKRNLHFCDLDKNFSEPILQISHIYGNYHEKQTLPPHALGDWGCRF